MSSLSVDAISCYVMMRIRDLTCVRHLSLSSEMYALHQPRLRPVQRVTIGRTSGYEWYSSIALYVHAVAPWYMHATLLMSSYPAFPTTAATPLVASSIPVA